MLGYVMQIHHTIEIKEGVNCPHGIKNSNISLLKLNRFDAFEW